MINELKDLAAQLIVFIAKDPLQVKHLSDNDSNMRKMLVLIEIFSK